jgi:DNA-directed RNA polymerase specialized sigma24 family protein
MEENNLPKEKVKYVSNKELKKQLILFKRTGIMTDKLHLILFEMCKRIISKNNWNRYTWKEDMVSDAYLKCLEIAKRFDTTRDNPFSYFTTVIHNFYKDYIKYEKKQKKIKNNTKLQYDSEMYFKYGILPTKNEIEFGNGEEGNDS